MSDAIRDVAKWHFKLIVGPRRGSMSEAFQAGLMWKHPEGQVLCALILKRNGPTLECWTNVGVGEATAGMKYDITSITAAELVSVLGRLESTLHRFFPMGTPVGPDGILDPRLSIASEARKEPEVPKEAPVEPPPPAPEPPPVVEAAPVPVPELREVVPGLEAPPPNTGAGNA